MPYITDIYAREVLDSGGNPTVEVEVQTESGAIWSCNRTIRASTGEHELVELRDGENKNWLFLGKGGVF